jgi:hypothetical protein
MRRLILFVRLPRAERRLLMEAASGLTLAQLQVRLFGFRRLAQRLGVHMAQAPQAQPEAVLEARRIRYALDVAARNLPWKPVCLPQAIAATRMLRRRGIASTLYLGVDRTRDLDAHAWVRVGGVVVTGGPVDDRFAVVSTFA